MKKQTTFDLEEERLKNEVKKRQAKRVLIQLPEGLKIEGPRLASVVEKAGALAVVLADPCYGACDMAFKDAQSIGADLLVHYGHSKMGRQEHVPTIYVETKALDSVKGAVKKALPLLKPWKNIGLVTIVQHVDMLSEARQTLLEAGKSVAFGDAGRMKYPGQVVGCDYSNAIAVAKDVEAFLFVGGGRFHAIGVALATAKPTIVADPYERRAYSVENEVKRIIKQRLASIDEAKQAVNIGVLVGLKSAQGKLDIALRIKEKLGKVGKKATLLALREVKPEALMQFPTIEAFVNTACPRISLDDASSFLKPVLTLEETLVVLGESTWEELLQKGWFKGST